MWHGLYVASMRCTHWTHTSIRSMHMVTLSSDSMDYTFQATSSFCFDGSWPAETKRLLGLSRKWPKTRSVWSATRFIIQKAKLHIYTVITLYSAWTTAPPTAFSVRFIYSRMRRRAGRHRQDRRAGGFGREPRGVCERTNKEDGPPRCLMGKAVRC